MGAPIEFVDDGGGPAVAADPAPVPERDRRLPFVRHPLVWLAVVLVVLAGGWAVARPHAAPARSPMRTIPAPPTGSWEIGPPYPRSRPFDRCPSYAMCARTPQWLPVG